LLACNSWISPSGFPPLQVIKADGTVNVIVFELTPLKTPSLPVVEPKLMQDGKSNDVTAEELKKQ
jgi:hypothetical protein